MGTPHTGDVIENKYRLERELGSGGMGAVWLATQLMVDRPVAVKLLHPAFDDEAELQARFEVEAKAIGRLNHPNVITLYDFGWSTELGAFYTVIEYIDGVSLDKRLNDRMPLAEVVDIIRQIALALDHAHHHGILHRDLKPENVMLARMTDGSQMAKVLDFGIARIVKGTYDRESPESQRITKAGEVFGTPAYMSPEQARSIRRLTPSSDLYSLGIMMYELVAGRLPFFANSAFDLLMLHVTKPVPPIERTDVPPAMVDLIFRLLDKEPDRRFQSGGELARALSALRIPEPGAYDPNDEFDGYPTFVDSGVPTFEREALQKAFAEPSQDGVPVALPTPTMAPGPPSGPMRASTVLMNGGAGGQHYAPTGEQMVAPQDEISSKTLILIAVAVALILALILVVVTLTPKAKTEHSQEGLQLYLQGNSEGQGQGQAQTNATPPAPSPDPAPKPEANEKPAPAPNKPTTTGASPVPDGEPTEGSTADAKQQPSKPSAATGKPATPAKVPRVSTDGESGAKIPRVGVGD